MWVIIVYYNRFNSEIEIYITLEVFTYSFDSIFEIEGEQDK